jgi:signal transduction histidine kinase
MVRMCEDVIEVVWASHRREQGSQLTQPSSALRIQRYSSVGTTEVHHEGLSLILDISGGEWMLSCIPGAFQRILMNLATNSLKYTRKGTIHIKLTQESVNGKEDNLTQEHGVMVFLTVKDTGIGMSEEFLQYKLFTPFAQESTLSPGTGMLMNLSSGDTNTDIVKDWV